MAGLALAILLLVLLSEAILFFGYTAVTNFAYNAWLEIRYKKEMNKQRKLKHDALQLRAEIRGTSSQDEFAKWAKLRRKLDSTVTQLEKLNSELAFSRTSFELKFKSALWILTNGFQAIIIILYRKTPVFYLPMGWFGPVRWLVSFPFAPTGSVSVTVWFLVCRSVVRQGLEVLQVLLPPIVERSVQTDAKSEHDVKDNLDVKQQSSPSTSSTK
ncbi:uncharacterized protein VTP21DRAFT_373 [Calcarisporiella thermophila]|uniref:uncharacterized protein n=1 Tax=Calcarisporiella thermophila TaxID=911321 RepID=UPI00374246A4